MTAPLSPRQLECLRLLTEGYSSKDIARQMALSVHTVNQHIGEIYRRLGVSKNSQAVAVALRRNLV